MTEERNYLVTLHKLAIELLQNESFPYVPVVDDYKVLILLDTFEAVCITNCDGTWFVGYYNDEDDANDHRDPIWLVSVTDVNEIVELVETVHVNNELSY